MADPEAPSAAETQATLPAPPADALPTALGVRYQLLTPLGQGGMGVVYKARDLHLSRLCALKFIRGGDPALWQRFQQEARAQARVDHPNVCRVYEVGEVADQRYIAMQLIDGEPLDVAGPSMTLPQKLLVLQKVAEAVHAAHEQGVIHRDLKPANILIERRRDGDGPEQLRPVVMDFGLARESGAGQGVTETGQVLGTPSYMSPEQARGDVRSLDRRTDVYSLGATLYELLVHEAPFEDEAVFKILLRVMNEEPPAPRRRRPELPAALDTIVLKCLSKEREQRYPTALALADDLGRVLAAQRIRGKRASLWYRAGYRVRRNPALFALGLSLLFSLLALLGYGLRSRLLAQRREHAAEQQAALAQRLGQEIKDMEWLLRSARQLPLHDLRYERSLILARLARLAQTAATSGDLLRGPSEYAIGRGHLALHDYPQALTHLQAAIAAGAQGAEVYATLGLTLGKHFERARHETRLSGGGEWARRKLRELVPRYLNPAIAALQRSRALQPSTSPFLDALLASYQGDEVHALQAADRALKEEPWLYEAAQLAGDLHLERALRARDRNDADTARAAFSLAVGRYQEAAAIGRSDAQVFEALGEAWMRRVETDNLQGRPHSDDLAQALALCDQLDRLAPTDVSGPRLRAWALVLANQGTNNGTLTVRKAEECITAADEARRRAPLDPYASDAAANCARIAAIALERHGRDWLPVLRQGIAVLEPVLVRHPDFVWGLNDLSALYIYLALGLKTQDRGASSAALREALALNARALQLDPSYTIGLFNRLDFFYQQALLAERSAEVTELLPDAAQTFERCMKQSNGMRVCQENYAIFLTVAARLAQKDGLDPRPLLEQANAQYRAGPSAAENWEVPHGLALAHLIDARDLQTRGQDPGPALAAADQAIRRCLAIDPKAVLCQQRAAEHQQLRRRAPRRP